MTVNHTYTSTFINTITKYLPAHLNLLSYRHEMIAISTSILTFKRFTAFVGRSNEKLAISYLKFYYWFTVRFKRINVNRMLNYYCIAVLALLASPVWSYSSGSPKTGCNNLGPMHKHEDQTPIKPQDSPAPYILKSASQVKVSESLKVKLNATGNQNIEGFLIQAFLDGKPVGTFATEAGYKHAQPLQCIEGQDNTLTHKKIKGENIKQIEFLWTPSSDLKSKKVQFVATVAANHDEFWIKKVKSEVTVV